MKRTALFAALAALLLVISISLPSASNALPAAQAQDGTVQLTVYNQDLALVSETRAVPLKVGLNEVVYSNVAALIDPTSVSFKSLTDPEGTEVLEQNFEYDLVGSTKLLQKYIDQVIVVQTRADLPGLLLGRPRSGLPERAGGDRAGLPPRRELAHGVLHRPGHREHLVRRRGPGGYTGCPPDA